MRKLFTTLLGVVAIAVAAAIPAQAEQIAVGYSYGELSTQCPLKIEGDNADISAAIQVPQEYAATLKGATIDKIRVGIFLRTYHQKVTVWIRESLDGPNVAEGSVTGQTSLSKGWNTIALESKYTIGDKGFYIGYTYNQKRICSSMVAIEGGKEGTFYVQAPGEAWADRHDLGTLCIEAFAEGTRPACDVNLAAVKLNPYLFLNTKALNGSAKIANLGATPVTGITVEGTLVGRESVQAHADCNIAPGEASWVSFSIPTTVDGVEPGSYDVNLNITGVDGGTDANMANNKVDNAGAVTVIEKGWTRRVLVEEFTGEKCGNCPAAANMLHNILQNSAYERVEALCHHAGYYDDSFTLPTDNALTWFYNPGVNGGTYAPAFMVDRVYVASEKAPVFFAANAEALTSRFDARLEKIAMANVSVDFEVPADDATEFTVTFNLERGGNILNDKGRCTVYLVEDNVKAVSQSGGGSNWKHQHLTRETNSAFGEPILWDENNKFSFDYTFKLKPEFKREDMRVVAVISNYNKSDLADNEVENVGVRLLDGTKLDDSGIHGTISDKAERTVKGIYDLMGNRRANIGEGINIVVFSDGTSMKIMK